MSVNGSFTVFSKTIVNEVRMVIILQVLSKDHSTYILSDQVF